ncbi:PREDICTED: mothers against decapentaplegic homolog 6-like [Priapulus caudatus]|uniref:Mothers against decapentaplegic homolog 6-like n=1 Tax=Priapulus caudatus TaxID=37621 RepID=A0ABM1F897_PRICU|nr:PREDICTED: mothers against decapentaplegic homolog 6-like [Priapulus caudatus]
MPRLCSGCMFPWNYRMPGFRRRTALVKRLWRLRKCELGVEQDGGDSRDFIAAAGHNCLKQLSDEQLATLLEAVTGGGTATDCVHVPYDPVETGSGHVSPHVLFCEIWRWPDLRANGGLLKRLSTCPAPTTASVCVNPFHWSRLCTPESPPPPYRASTKVFSEELRRREDEQGRLYGDSSTETCDHYRSFTGQCADCENSDSTPRSHHHWCTIAYWEHTSRVGRHLQVYNPSISVYSHLPHTDGMCLRILQNEQCSGGGGGGHDIKPRYETTV